MGASDSWAWPEMFNSCRPPATANSWSHEMSDNIVKLDGLVPERLAPKTRKIVLQDYSLPVDIGFHDFEIGNPQRLFVTVEVWVDETSFPDDDQGASAWNYDFLRTEIGRLAAGRRFNLQETF